MTDEEVLEYRRKLNDENYMNKAINAITENFNDQKIIKRKINKGEKDMQNSLIDLNNHLFAQLERLGDEELSQERLDKEISRAKSIVSVAQPIIENARLVLDAHIAKDQAIDKLNIPGILLGEKVLPSEIPPLPKNGRKLIGTE